MNTIEQAMRDAAEHVITNDLIKKELITALTVHPPLRPVKMGLFHTMDSLQSVVDLALSQLPITTPNAIVSLLMIYQNTLLNILEQETNFVPRKEL